MAERNAANGYMAIGKQTLPGTPVVPSIYTPYYKQTLETNISLIRDDPVYGNKYRHFQSLQGMRKHTGTISAMAEANTAAYWLDMLATHTAVSGANPYTHTYGTSTTDPNFYTVDISFVSQVVRFFGVAASKLKLGFDSGKMVFDLDVSGLGSFYGREIASIATTVLTLKTDYDATPTTGLVIGDLVKVTTADGVTSTNFTVSSFTATTVTLNASAAAFAAGDMIVLRPATPSLSLQTPFLWGKTEFRFGATAAAALSATQTRLEQGSEVTLMHDFENNDGAARSGGFDPAALVRTQYELSFNKKQFFDTTEELKYWNAISKRSCVMRSFAGSTSQYELRVTMNNIRSMTNATPTESGGVIYHELDYAVDYDQTDGQAFDVKVIDAIATV